MGRRVGDGNERASVARTHPPATQLSALPLTTRPLHPLSPTCTPCSTCHLRVCSCDTPPDSICAWATWVGGWVGRRRGWMGGVGGWVGGVGVSVVGWMARRSALHSLALAPDPPPPTHPLAPRPPPSPTPPAAAQPPAYSHAHNQGMIIPQSKVDLTSAVNEFAHKVRQRGAAARTQGGVCERASGFARKVRVARGGGSTQPASYS